MVQMVASFPNHLANTQINRSDYKNYNLGADIIRNRRRKISTDE